MSTWEERMSQRAKAREAIAEAEQILRDEADGIDDDSGFTSVYLGQPDSARTVR